MSRKLLQHALEALVKHGAAYLGHEYAYDGAIKTIRAHLANPQKEPVACEWTEDAGEMWQSSCGEALEFSWGGPVENGVKFCHGCGKPIEIVGAP